MGRARDVGVLSRGRRTDPKVGSDRAWGDGGRMVRTARWWSRRTICDMFAAVLVEGDSVWRSRRLGDARSTSASVER